MKSLFLMFLRVCFHVSRILRMGFVVGESELGRINVNALSSHFFADFAKPSCRIQSVRT